LQLTPYASDGYQAVFGTWLHKGDKSLPEQAKMDIGSSILLHQQSDKKVFFDNHPLESTAWLSRHEA